MPRHTSNWLRIVLESIYSIFDQNQLPCCKNIENPDFFLTLTPVFLTFIKIVVCPDFEPQIVTYPDRMNPKKIKLFIYFAIFMKFEAPFSYVHQ